MAQSKLQIEINLRICSKILENSYVQMLPHQHFTSLPFELVIYVEETIPVANFTTTRQLLLLGFWNILETFFLIDVV